LRTRAIPERFCGGDSLQRGTISSVYSFTFTIVCVVRFDFSVTEAELESLAADFGGVYKVPDNFEAMVTPYNPQTPRRQAAPEPQMHINPQTTLICEMLGVTDPFAVFSGRRPPSGVHADIGLAVGAAAVDENTNDSLDVDDRDEGILDDSDFINSTLESSSSFAAANSTFNPDEISLDDLDEDDGDGLDAGVAAAADSCEPPSKRPSFSPSHSTSETEFTTDNSEDVVSNAIKPDSPDPKLIASATPVSRPGGSFKRRNFAIYNTADNSSNDSD